MQNTLFDFTINLEVNLQTIGLESQMHFNFSLMELHPSAALGDRKFSKQRGERRGPLRGPLLSPTIKHLHRSPSVAEGV
jgi:hypothetical protein